MPLLPHSFFWKLTLDCISGLLCTTKDVELKEWKASGLRVASTVRLSRLDCLESSLLLGKVGQILPSDAKVVKDVWDLRIKPQF